MARERFIDRNFRGGSLAIIQHANEIIRDYRAQGFTLTLRQLYYQFVSRDLLPNKQSEYKRLGSIINDARLAGEIDWSAIEDRTRNVASMAHWDSPESIVEACASQYKDDLWSDQSLIAEDITPIVLHLGDHDPSGIDMTRDNRDRMSMFAHEQVEVVRLALNYDQVEQYDPPPNPAKDTDSRAADYVAEYGESSWELDALSPSVIAELVERAISGYVDMDKWAEREATERASRATLRGISERWDDVQDFLGIEDEE